MPPTRWMRACGIAAALACSPAQAEPPLEGPTYRTEHVVQEALAASPRLHALAAQVALQEERARAGAGLANPEVRLRNLSNRAGDERFGEMEIGLRWRLPRPGESAAQKRRGTIKLWQEKVEAQRVRHRLAERVRRVCADIRLHHERADLAAARADNERRRLGQLEQMVELGRLGVVDFTKATLALSRADDERKRRLHALHSAQTNLQRLLGADRPPALAAEDLPEVNLGREYLLKIAYARRPEFGLLQAQQPHAATRQRLLPALSFIEISHHREQGAGDWQELALALEVPLFGRGLTDASGAAAREALAVRARVRDEVHDAFDAYTAAGLAWRQAAEEVETLTATVDRLIDRTQAHGAVGADEILKLERLVADARDRVAQRRHRAAYATYALWYALGVEGPEQAAAPAEE